MYNISLFVPNCLFAFVVTDIFKTVKMHPLAVKYSSKLDIISLVCYYL